MIILSSGGGVYVLDGFKPLSPVKIPRKIQTRGIDNDFFYDTTTLHSLFKLGCHFKPVPARGIYVCGITYMLLMDLAV